MGARLISLDSRDVVVIYARIPNTRYNLLVSVVYKDEIIYSLVSIILVPAIIIIIIIIIINNDNNNDDIIMIL
jgi:hypothetical protein